VVFHAVDSSTSFPALRNDVLDRLIALDAEGNADSPNLWPVFRVKAADDALAQRVREMALHARLYRVAGQAFGLYMAGTPLGKKEFEKDGGRAFLQECLQNAFTKETEASKVDFLESLVYTETDRSVLKEILQDKKTEITVSKAQFGLLKVAWAKAPKLLDYLIVEDKPQPATQKAGKPAAPTASPKAVQ
jgi:hypothetical protein